MFIQDEYRFINRTVAAIRDLGIDLLFTCVPEPEIDKVYSPQALPRPVRVNVLTGYVPPTLALRAVPVPADRPIDIGYRGRRLPAHLGRLSQEKSMIGEHVAAEAPRYGLVTDISCREEDRIYGEEWINFISRCKAMLGVESGASVFDFTGEIERQVTDHLRREPDVSYETLERLYLGAHEGKIRLNQISPRCFEAAALRTLMILYEGEYSGILKPWHHYVPLKKDHSNMADVVAVLRDPEQIAKITERAYREVALDARYSYASAVAQVDDAIDALIRPEMLARRRPYTNFGFRSARKIDGLKLYRGLKYQALQMKYQALQIARWLFLRVALGWMPEQRREKVWNRIREWRGIKPVG